MELKWSPSLIFWVDSMTSNLIKWQCFLEVIVYCHKLNGNRKKTTGGATSDLRWLNNQTVEEIHNKRCSIQKFLLDNHHTYFKCLE